MKNEILQFLHAPEFDACREQINRENRLAIHLLAAFGLPLSLVNAITQYFVVGSSILPRTVWLAVYFVLVLLLDRRILSENARHTTARLYLLQAPAMLIVILLGTVWDPNRQATSFMLFLLAMPVFVFDKPLRLTAIHALWCLVFLLFCRMAKNDELLVVDAIHVLEFFFASTAVTYVVLSARLRSLENLNQAEYLLDHDPQTGCLSRYELASRTDRYLGSPLTVLLCELDRFAMFRDLYGAEIADEMLLFFALSMQEVFGPEYTYRYSGDEILCISLGTSPETCRALTVRCRERLKGYSHAGTSQPLSFALGYVTGTANSPAELQQMIQLADLYAHQAKERGTEQTEGSVFSEQLLHDAITQNSVSANTRSYEIDPLTGLPNMSFFVTRADEAIASIVDLSREPVVAYFKITNLRDFNSRFGYTQGDRLIAETGLLLHKVFERRLLCRISSGNFGLMCYRSELETLMPKVREALKRLWPGFTVRCAVGYAPSSGKQSTISLLDEARIALKYRDRKADELLCYYSETMETDRRLQQYIIEHVDEAIEKGWLQVYYQPIARAVTGEVCNEEALSRWDDPEHGMLMPIRFITPLEESGLMYKVNLNVVRIILRDIKRRQELGVPVVPVSVNLSRRDFEQHDMVGAISALVAESGLSSDLLKIEITESAFIANQELLAQQVEAFHRAGFEVWMDDFGSEYSTLNLLQELNFDLLKIDMKFMKDFAEGERNYIIVSDVIDMARRMGITTLIEGVETQEQYDLVHKLGCEKLQGFLFNSPHPFDYITDRALNGTGLHFEDPQSAPYYEAIGRVDLNTPLTLADEFQMSREMPTGILEARDGVYTCLRGSDRFYRALTRWGLLADSESRVLQTPLPEVFQTAIDACTPDGRWISFLVEIGGGQSITGFVRCVSPMQYRGATALLTVLLPGRGSMGEI